MADLDAVLEQLRQERKRAEGELRQLEKVIRQLSKVRAYSQASSGTAKGKKRQLSAAARERIAAAQRTRWAKVRAQSKKTL
jgi:hypothetical protein